MSRRYQRAAVLGALVAAVVAVGGCSSGAAGGAGNAAGGAPAAGNGGSGKGHVLGLVAFDMTSQADAQFDTSSTAAFKSAGWTVLSQDPKGDPGQANAICTQYVTRHVTALAITTYAKDQMAQCMSQASAAKIPVFFIGSPLSDGMAGAVDVTAPQPINDVFVNYLKTNAVTNLLTLDYTPGTPCRLRAAYRDAAIKKAGLSIKVTKHEFPIPGQVVDSQSATVAWLAAHPAGSGKYAIWSCFADSTAGAVAGIAQARRTDNIPIFTWDFNKSILSAIRSGKVAGDLYINGAGVGTQVLNLVKGYLAGGKPQGVVANNLVLTKDNIDKFLTDHPELLK